MKEIVALVLLAATAVNAQIQVCQNIRPGPVQPWTIKMAATAYSNSYSSLTVNWPRPNDAPGGQGAPSCITDYSVDVYRRDGTKIQQATVSGMSPVHDSASYTATGLLPNEPYTFSVTAKGPGGVGPTDPNRSQAFTTAAAPAPTPQCGQPQQVTNIRREGAQMSGSMVQMTIAWDKPYSTPAECIKEYSVTVYEAGKSNAIKTTTIYAPSTRYTDNVYYPGKSYEFWIYARNPNMGAMGNGIGLRSQPIWAPTQAVPL